MDWPFVYCNGDSYSDQHYRHDLVGKTYAHFLAQRLHGFAMNKAKTGSCNQRILRVSLHDLIQQKQLNSEQPVVALLGLTYELRSELWIDSDRDFDQPEESHFFRHQIAFDIAWHRDLLDGIFADKNLNQRLARRLGPGKKFLKSYQEGRAFFYSPYQERITELMQIYLMIEWCKQHDINLLIFSAAPPFDTLQTEYLKDFFLSTIESRHVLDLETFSMCHWCRSQGFRPYESDTNIDNGHYGPDAHEAFASFLFEELEQRDLLKGITCPNT